MSQIARHPAVSGQFYPESEKELRDMLKTIEQSLGTGKQFDLPSDRKIIGIIVPHAGYVYSGRTAMAAFRLMRGKNFSRFVLIGPNHNSEPYYSAMFDSGKWETPLGDVDIDTELCQKLGNTDAHTVIDRQAHSLEHSVEVEIPFLQYIFGENFKICPIIMGNQEMPESIALANALHGLNADFTLIISSDLTHYESLESATTKDQLLISSITSLNVKEFYETLRKYDVSACGYGPIAVLMEYTRLSGGKIELVDHSTSYDHSRNSRNVVGYCSMIAHGQ